MSSTPSVADGTTQSVGFLLLDKFTLMSLASAVEPLRMANQLTGRTLYRWHTYSQKITWHIRQHSLIGMTYRTESTERLVARLKPIVPHPMRTPPRCPFASQFEV